MKKETIIATILGILAGVVIAIALILRTQKTTTPESPLIPSVSPQVTITETQDKTAALSINQPKDKQVFDSNEVTIAGKAPIGSLMVMQSASSDQVVKTDKENFEIKFPLSLGENVISISSYFNKDRQDKTLTVYYIENEK